MDDLRQTTAFVAAAETLHLGRAARDLGVHPATLAARLRALESRLGIVLVDRSHRCRIALTQAGAALLPAARRAVAAAEDLDARAADVRRGALGVVRVALTSDRDPMIDALLRDIRDVDPAWEVEVDRMDVGSAGRALAVGGVECAIGRGRQQPRTTPGLLDRRPNRLERARSARVVDGPRGAEERTLVVTWRTTWGSDASVSAARHAPGDAPSRRSGHLDALVSLVRRLVREADDRWRPEVAAHRRAAEARRAAAAARRRAAEAERALLADETARFGFDAAAARAVARERADVLRLVAEARASGRELSVHLLIRWLCLPREDGDAPSLE